MRGLNLLPWREQLRVKRKQQFLYIFYGSIIGAVLIVLLIHGVIANKISNQKLTNQRIQTEITSYVNKINAIQALKTKNNQLMEYLNLIYELQASRPWV